MDNRNVVWTNDGALVVCLFIKAIVIALLLYSVAHYSFYSPEASEDVAEANKTIETNGTEELPLINKTRMVMRKIILQPSCPISYIQTIFQELLLDLHFKKEGCTPEDITNTEKHKIPRPPPRPNKTTNPRGTIVVYFAVGLLLASLGAACLEFFKAKGQEGSDKSKTPLTRKCSLADLTVLRHSRKELVRRESVLEGVVEHQAGSLKTLAHRPVPLLRRCSFPVAPGDAASTSGTNTSCGHSSNFSLKGTAPTGSRRTSVDNDHSPEHSRHWHARLVRRH